MKVAYLKECLKEYFKKFLLSRWQQKKKSYPTLVEIFLTVPSSQTIHKYQEQLCTLILFQVIQTLIFL